MHAQNLTSSLSATNAIEFFMDSIVHFEIPADDTKRAGKFYSEVFGWQLNPVPNMEYTMVGTTPIGEDGRPKEPGGINGGMTKRGGPVEHIVVTVGVQDIEATLRNIERSGGRIVSPKTPVGDMGFAAYFNDTEGNVVGLFQPTGRM